MPLFPLHMHPARRVAALICAAQALVLAGFGIFYLTQVGSGADAARVLTEGVLILVFAGGLGLLARLWLGGSDWPGTPTVVWHLLLIPVIVAMFQSGQVLIALAMAVAVLAAIGAVAAQRQPSA